MIFRDELVVTPAQMKMLEEESDKAGNSYELLMEHAGMGLAYSLRNPVRYMAEKVNDERQPEIIFLCGNGNNAGDCFVAARYLKEMDVKSVIFLLCGEPKTHLARLNFDRMEDIPVIREEEEMLERLDDSLIDIKVDGVFGTGFHGELPENVKRIFAKCDGVLIAADVPSGGNCRTGEVSEGTLRVNTTMTFGNRKFGMTQYPLREHCNYSRIIHIPISDKAYDKIDYPVIVLDEELIMNPNQTEMRRVFLSKFPERKPDSHKGNFGRLLTVCGSETMPGAAIMPACAAARCGVGLLTVCTPKAYLPQFAAKLPEAMYLPLETADSGTYTVDSLDKIIRESEKCTAVLIGCGLGNTSETRELVKKLVLNINCPIILDADGINCIADSIDIIKQAKSDIILTPHPAEMGRLCGMTAKEIQADRLEVAKSFAQENNCTVVLKGAGTIIAFPDMAYVNTTGNPGMSKGGSGDVLSGIIASLAAQGIPAQTGVFIHGKAGDRAAEKHSMQSMLPTDMIDELGGIFKELER